MAIVSIYSILTRSPSARLRLASRKRAAMSSPSTEAAGASAALGWLAARAESAKAPSYEGLADRARELSRGVGIQLGGEDRPFN